MTTAVETPVEFSLVYSSPPRRDHGWWVLVRLILICVAARMALLFVLPCKGDKACISTDLQIWSVVAGDLTSGHNPYANPTNHLMNWPPFWMEVLYGVTRVAQPYTWKFYFYVRTVLIAGDVMMLGALWWVLGLLDEQKPRENLLLWGYCLNPLLILLTVQHGHFDVYPMLCVTLFLGFLIQFSQTRRSIDWLFAAGCLGMGIFAKTFPLVLWPLLVPGAARMNWRTCAVAAFLVLGPAAFSLVPMYVLNPDMVQKYVIGYRSLGSEFGVMSVLNLAGASGATIVSYQNGFAKMLLAGSLVLGIILPRFRFRQSDLVLLAGMLLLSVFTLGPGYGQQYWFWAIPPFLICYRHYPEWFAKLLSVGLWITVATNVFLCAVVTWLGGFLSIGLNIHSLLQLSDRLRTDTRLLEFIQLPMTFAAFAILLGGVFLLLTPAPFASPDAPAL
jgi:hypothetical protein